jgi:hypothetical protein
MIKDDLNIFQLIKTVVLTKFDDVDCYAMGSRISQYPGAKYDFDFLININVPTREEYLTKLRLYKLQIPAIKNEFIDMKDEFDNLVKIDISFTQDADKMNDVIKL